MRLSEAIRLGAMLRPQGRLLFINGDKSCALGAAMESTGLSVLEFHLLKKSYPILDTIKSCPGCLKESRTFVSLVIGHLNDDHRWSRERIADWLESVESSEVPDEIAAVDRVEAAAAQ